MRLGRESSDDDEDNVENSFERFSAIKMITNRYIISV